MQSWIHPSGLLAILFECSAEPPLEELAELHESLSEQTLGAPAQLAAFVAALKQSAPWLEQTKSLAILISDGKIVRWTMRGPIGIVRVPVKWRATQNEKPLLLAANGQCDTADDYMYLLASSSAAPNVLKTREFRELDQASYAGFEQALGSVAGKNSWRALLFPVEYHSSYTNPSWKRVRFVGAQEDYEHELHGLRALGDALDAQPDFAGSVILGGQHVAPRWKENAPARKGETILGDGVLVSPLGIYLLELKHWEGHFLVEPRNANAPILRLRRDGSHTPKPNPIRALEVAARTFKSDHAPSFPVYGLLVFTHPQAKVECIDPSGKVHPAPFDCVCKVQDVAREIRAIAGARRLSKQEIEGVVKQFGPKPNAHVSRDARAPAPLRFGRFLVSPEPIAAESTPYCDVLEVRVDGQERRLWAKRYTLQTLTSSLEVEEERVGREVRILQDFSGEPGFYRFLDRVRDGSFYYVFVERVDGVRLDAWLVSEQPSRARRLAVLTQIAQVLAKLASANVVHRALAPSAIRVGAADRVTIVNFDLCQISSLATVDARARAQLDPAYLSRDAATPGRKLAPADDSFSFGKLCCLVLGGKLPFETAGIDPMFLRKPSLWSEYALAHGIGERELADIRKLLSQVRDERPVGEALVSLVESWA